MNFQQQLEIGKVGECKISKWLMKRGWNIMPAYEKITHEYKGPQIFSNTKNLVAPDMFIFNSTGCKWVEAKQKTGMSFHRNTGRWVNGIDKRHFLDYLDVKRISNIPVFIMFLCEGMKTKDSPDMSPSGLFAAEIEELNANINHQSDHWGRSGMVYWSRQCDGGPLVKISNLENM